MAPKPWTGISTACTHWFSWVPREKNHWQDRHGGQTLASVAVCPWLPCPRKRALLCFPQGPAQDFGQGLWKEKGMRPCLALLLFRDMAQNLQCPRLGQGFVARSGDEALPILPGGRPMRVLDVRCVCGRFRKARHQALEGGFGQDLRLIEILDKGKARLETHLCAKMRFACVTTRKLAATLSPYSSCTCIRRQGDLHVAALLA